MQKIFMKILFVAAAVFVAGCAPFQNLSVADVKTQSHLAGSGKLPIPPHDAASCAERTNFICGPGGGGSIVKNPDNPNEFSIYIYGMGLTQANPYVIIDFSGDGNGSTDYRGYTAMKTWDSMVEVQIKRISACGDCGKLK